MKRSPTKGLRAPLIVVASFLLVACERAPAAVPTPSPSTLALAWSYRSELHWLVDAQVRSLAALARLADPASAQDLRTEPSGERTFRVFSQSGTWTYRPEPHAWSPAALQEVAQGLYGDQVASAPASSGGEDTELLTSLAELGWPTLERWNNRLSEALQQQPLAAARHEQAAFLLVAFALREPGTWYFDVRTPLCRISAHLAAARLLRRGEPPGEAGALAEAALSALAGRQVEALSSLDAIEVHWRKPHTAAWIRALRVRACGDWRRVAPGRGTLVERLERFRALRDRAGPDAAGRYLEEHESQDLADWGRLLLRGTPATVSDGNRYIPRLLGLELAEIGGVLGEVEPLPGALARHLAVQSTPGGVEIREGRPTLRILDRGLWAAFFERRLAEYAGAAVVHLRQLLGLEDAAKQMIAQLDGLMGGLPLYRFSRLRLNKSQSELERQRPDIEALFASSPERITTGNWWSARERPGFGPGLTTLPPSSSWFSAGGPPGTVYINTAQRNELVLAASREFLEGLQVLAPYNTSLALELVNRQGKQASVETILRYRKDAAYNRAVLVSLAELEKGDPARYLARYEQICVIDPDGWVEVADYLREHGTDEQATVRAHEKMVALARDRVTVSNSVAWLVDYYRRKGRLAEAFRLAREAADVYSAGGLSTYAELCEKTGRYEEAEQYFRRVAERYDNRGHLAGYYRRSRERLGAKAYDRKMQDLLHEVLPKGPEAVSLGDLRERPRDGALIKGSNDKVVAAGLERGSVIVAVNGKRVRSLDAFRVLMAMEEGTDFRLIAWHRGGYVETTASLPDRGFGVWMITYQP
jgi:hypothetical protein